MDSTHYLETPSLIICVGSGVLESRRRRQPSYSKEIETEERSSLVTIDWPPTCTRLTEGTKRDGFLQYVPKLDGQVHDLKVSEKVRKFILKNEGKKID